MFNAVVAFLLIWTVTKRWPKSSLGDLFKLASHLHSSSLSITADRSWWPPLSFVQLSVKSENQETHQQCCEDEDERSHKIPVDSLRVANSGHGAITGAE